MKVRGSAHVVKRREKRYEPIEDTVRAGTASEALAVLRKALDCAYRVKVVTAEGHDGVGSKGFAADQAGEGEVLLVGIGVRIVAAVPSLLLLHERARSGRVGEEGVVELPAMHVVAAVVQELKEEKKGQQKVGKKGIKGRTLQVSPKPQNPVSAE